MRNIIVVTFTDPSNAYRALSVVKELDKSGRLSLHSAAVVERETYGELEVRDYADRTAVVSSPHGLVGKMIDGAMVTDESVDSAARIPAGTTGLIADVDEYAVEVIDGAMSQLDGTVFRESTDDVKAAYKAADQARSEAEEQQARAEKEQHKQERERDRAEAHNERLDHAEQRLGRLEQRMEGHKETIPAQPGQTAQTTETTQAAGGH